MTAFDWKIPFVGKRTRRQFWWRGYHHVRGRTLPVAKVEDAPDTAFVATVFCCCTKRSRASRFFSFSDAVDWCETEWVLLDAECSLSGHLEAA